MMSSLRDWLRRTRRVTCQTHGVVAGGGECEMWLLHVGDEESHKLVDVVCRVEDALVVRQFLQHLQTLKDTQETASPLHTYLTGVKVLRTMEVCCWRT